MWQIGEVKTSTVFWFLMGFMIGVYIVGNWNNTTDSFLTKIGTIFTIGGSFVAGYIALWAYQNEVRRRRHERDENKYYQISLHENLSILSSYLDSTFQWKVGWPLDEKKRTEFLQETAKYIPQMHSSILGICEDMQILNLNPYVPPDIKDSVGILIRQARKTISFGFEGEGVLLLNELVFDVYRRINLILKTGYMKEFKDVQF